MGEVRHSFALDCSGLRVDIHEPASPPYSCLICSEEMIAKQGEVVAWHFAHKRLTTCGGGESELHRYTWRNIALGIEGSLTRGKPYPIMVDCRGCKRVATIPIPESAALKTNKQILPGVRPDVAVLNAGRKLLFAIEVVVTSELSTKAWITYRRANAPVIRYRSQWATVDELGTSLHGEMLGTRWRCDACLAEIENTRLERDAIERETKQKAAEIKEIVEPARLRTEMARPTPEPRQLTMSLPEPSSRPKPKVNVFLQAIWELARNLIYRELQATNHKRGHSGRSKRNGSRGKNQRRYSKRSRSNKSRAR